jgi:hypothetical protein
MYDHTAGVMNSGDGFKKFMRLLSGINEFTLHIREVA